MTFISSIYNLLEIHIMCSWKKKSGEWQNHFVMHGYRYDVSSNKTMMLNLSSPLFFEFTIRLNNTALSIKGSIFLYDKIRFSSCLNIIAIIDLFASFVIQMILQLISVVLFYMECTLYFEKGYAFSIIISILPPW